MLWYGRTIPLKAIKQHYVLCLGELEVQVNDTQEINQLPWMKCASFAASFDILRDGSAFLCVHTFLFNQIITSNQNKTSHALRKIVWETCTSDMISLICHILNKQNLLTQTIMCVIKTQHECVVSVSNTSISFLILYAVPIQQITSVGTLIQNNCKII